MSITTALAKPVRVIQELSPTELFIRATEKATAVRDAGRARLDADFVERIEEARARYLVADDTPAHAGNGATPTGDTSPG